MFFITMSEQVYLSLCKDQLNISLLINLTSSNVKLLPHLFSLFSSGVNNWQFSLLYPLSLSILSISNPSL